jgi:hypothetical protein
VRVTSTTNPAYTDTSDDNFTIPSPTITVTSPNGGESWAVGSRQTIEWTYTGNPGAYVKIELFKGETLNKVITSRIGIGRGGTGTYSWAISSTQTLGSDYKVRVTSTTNPAYTDTSDDNFTIPLPTITVTYPNGGESWTIGGIQKITWASVGITGNVKVQLSRNGGRTWATLFSSTPNDGVQIWTVTGPATSQARIKVVSVSRPAVFDISDANFTINVPP